MKRAVRRRLFFGVLAAAVIAVIGFTVFYFYPREKTPSAKVYYFKDGNLTTVERPLKPDEPPLQKAIFFLLSPPAGLVTLIPPGTKILGVKAQGRTAVVNFSRKLLTRSGGAAYLQGMIAQIVFTATEIPGIERAWIWVEGKKEVVLGGEGLVLDRPLSRRDLGN